MGIRGSLHGHEYEDLYDVGLDAVDGQRDQVRDVVLLLLDLQVDHLVNHLQGPWAAVRW